MTNRRPDGGWRTMVVPRSVAVMAVATMAAVVVDVAALPDGRLGERAAQATAALAGHDGDRTLAAALVVLDPTGCGALTASGGGRVRAVSVGVRPGVIAVDTDASQCSGGNYGTDASGTGSTIAADPSRAGTPGSIRLYGLTQASCNMVDKACDPADAAGGTLSPPPVGATRRTGRHRVDARYNCGPDGGSLALRACPAGASEAHIDTLRAEIGATGLPAGYRDYRAEGYACDVLVGATVTVPAGNWWVDCSLSVSGRLTFTGGNLVFQDGLLIEAGGVVDVNASNPNRELSATCQAQVAGCTAESSANHAFAYFRSGSIDRRPGASLHFRNTFVYLHNGGVRLTGSEAALSWEAPGGYRAAASGPFRDLALWSESSATHTMTRGSALTLGGLFFTPNAAFTYAGGSPVRTRAQFVTFRFSVTGAGELQLAARP